MSYKTYIKTHSGKDFDLIDTTHNDFELEDVAHALSNICRFCGHVKEFYSVAQHSVMVSYLVEPQNALIGLLHDASEAFVGDVAKPLKELLPDYKQVEARIEEFVLGRFGIDPHNMPADIKRADLIALVTEQRDLMSGPDIDLMNAHGIEPLAQIIQPVSPAQAKIMFLERYREIRHNMHCAELDRKERESIRKGRRRAAMYDPSSEALLHNLLLDKEAP